MESQFLNFLNRIHQSYAWWQIAIQLLLIGAVMFWVVRFLQGTRGARMLKGIGMVLVTLYLIGHLVAQKLGLGQIDYLYGNFLVFAGFAAIVVFQPELRRALMRLGEGRIFGSWSREVGDEIEGLVESAIFLSRRKIGALVAIEREAGLAGMAENGTKIDAELSADLLNTIFWPNSPLHDLGVIVAQGRIAYAGVQFPLAESGELERELGSRHRAAVGLSQESDAIVLVVSEETGDISIAESGRLIRKLSPDSLRGMLNELLNRGGGDDNDVQRAAA
jgi:diadenylate cyclase